MLWSCLPRCFPSPLICTEAIHGCHGNSEVHDLVLIFQELTGKSLSRVSEETFDFEPLNNVETVNTLGTPGIGLDAFCIIRWP